MRNKRNKKYDKQPKGSVLLTSLWMMSILAVSTASLSFRGIQHLDLVKREMARLEHHMNATSGLNLAMQAILDDPRPHEDSRSERWRGRLALEPEWAKRMSVEVTDEESKLNLNTASQSEIETFLKIFDLDVSSLAGERKKIISGILKLREKSRIESYEELYLLEEVKSQDVTRLREYLTVYPESGLVNLNTVSPPVLKSLMRTLFADDLAKDQLLRKIEKFRAQNQDFLERDLTPEGLVKRLALPESPVMMHLVNRFLPLVTVDSRTYRMIIQNTRGGWAEAILVGGGDEPSGFRILSWRET